MLDKHHSQSERVKAIDHSIISLHLLELQNEKMARQRLSAEDRHVALLACAAFLIEDLGLSAHNAASLLNPAAIGTKRQSLERRFAGPERRDARIAAIAAGRALALTPAEDSESSVHAAPVHLEGSSLAPVHFESHSLAPEHPDTRSLAPEHSESATGAVPAELVAEWRAEAARQRSEVHATPDADAEAVADVRAITGEDDGARDSREADRVELQNTSYDPASGATYANEELGKETREEERGKDSRKRQR